MGRRSKADERKQEILENFYEVLKEEGFENASIAKIALRMDVNPSLLIHYFHTKEEMVVDVVDYILVRYEDAFLTNFEKAEEAEAQFRYIISVLFSVEWIRIIDHSVFYSCYYLATRHSRIEERFREMYSEFSKLIEVCIANCMDAGILAEDDPKEVAEFLISLNEGLNYYGHIFKDEEAYKARALSIRNRVLKSLGACIEF